MPIKWVMHWQPNSDTPLTTQIITEAYSCAESLPGAVCFGKWCSVMTYYRPIAMRDQSPELPRDLVGLAFHDLPDDYYFIMSSRGLILRADSSVQNIMDRLGSYKVRFVNHFEGLQYKLGDFRLRIAKCVNSPSKHLRGFMMEVEYLPLSSIEKSRRIMEEFFDIWQEKIAEKSLPGHFTNSEASFAEYGLGDNYTPQHTAVQYGVCILHINANSSRTL